MVEQAKLVGNMLNVVKSSFETGMQTMDTFQAQAEKAIQMGIENANALQNEANKAYGSWIESVNNARKLYTSAIEQGMSTLGAQMVTPKASKEK